MSLKIYKSFPFQALVYARRLTDVKHLVKNNHKKSKQLNPITLKESLKFAETQAKNIENDAVKITYKILPLEFCPDCLNQISMARIHFSTF